MSESTLREAVRDRIVYHCDERKYDFRLGKACVEPLIDDIVYAIAAWNRRAKPENEALTLDELMQIGGEPVYCVDADGSGAWALVHTQDEACTDANYGDWEFYCYGWRDNGKMNENGWLAYRRKPERSEG